jgi:hypothetical protein
VTATLTDLVMPRICHVPEAHDWSLGDRAVEWALEHGITLDPEQQMMLRAMLGLNGVGRWSTFEAAINAPRQNGKNEVLLALELFLLFELGVNRIVHSAHEFKTSRRHFSRMEMIIQANSDLLAKMRRSEKGTQMIIGFRYSHGEEAVELQGGASIEYRTRTKSGMKGFDDVALLVLDEAQILSEWAHGAMVPTLRASTAEHGPMLVYSGNAPDKEKHDHAVVWTRLRERGLACDDEDLVYMEYSLDFDTPEEIPEDIARDPEVWLSVNWAMAHGRITVEHMRKEIKTLGWREFCIELLGVGDYPETDLLGNSEISEADWLEREDTESVLVDPICLSFDVSPGRRTTIAAAGLNKDRKMHVEMTNQRAGTVWVPEKVAELCERYEVVEIACDGFGPGNAIAARIEEQTGLDVRRIKTGEYADACQQFATAVEEAEVTHIGQEDLTMSVRGARTRPLVDRWAWSRSKSKTDPGPVIACSVALWSAMDRDIANSEVMIF